MIARITTRIIKRRDDSALIDVSIHGEHVNTLSLAYVKRIRKQILLFR